MIIGITAGMLSGALLLLAWQPIAWQVASASLLALILAYWQSKRIKVSLFSELKAQAGRAFSPEFVALLDELKKSSTKLPRRLEIGDQLAEIGDPRPSTGLNEKGLPEIDWVKIPAGNFIYGEQKHLRYLETFYISRYPNTHAQYQVFIDDAGYQNPNYWQRIRRIKPEAARWTQGNRPQETVSWFEAVAFCRWLSQHLNNEIRLPTEQQWEKAARGSEGRNYSWGGGEKYFQAYANVDEKYRGVGSYYVEQTCAVDVSTLISMVTPNSKLSDQCLLSHYFG